MDTSGTKVLLQDGTVTDIISHNDNYLIVNVDGNKRLVLKHYLRMDIFL